MPHLCKLAPASDLHVLPGVGHMENSDVVGKTQDGARRVGDIAFEIAARHPPTSLLVSDHEIAMARSHLWEEYRIPSEYGAATAMAALTSGTYRTGPDERVAVIICGANTDAATLGIPPSSF